MLALKAGLLLVLATYFHLLGASVTIWEPRKNILLFASLCRTLAFLVWYWLLKSDG